MTYLILALNPGSTSTKIAIYADEEPLFLQQIDHSAPELHAYPNILAQTGMRKQLVLQALAASGVEPRQLAAVVGRGGMLPPVKGGGYLVNQPMIEELTIGRAKQHASNLGALIAQQIAAPLGIPAYIYDAVSTDELADVARVTGLPELSRQSFCHALNAKATARKVAAELGGSYESKRFIVAHIGGGISISAHAGGRIIDVITDDAGPFSPERSGSVPLGNIIDICYSGQYTKEELLEKIKKNSGIKGHLGTNDCREVEKMIAAGNAYAALIYEAQAYQIAKGIGEMAPPLEGRLDAVIITGGLAHSAYLVAEVERRVAYLGRIIVKPGENEMEAMALGALRILRGQEGYSLYER